MKLYDFTNPGKTTPEENLELMMVLFSCLLQSLQGKAITSFEAMQIDDSVYAILPEHLKKFFKPSV